MNKMKVAKIKITNKKGFRCCSDKTIEILDGVIEVGKEMAIEKKNIGAALAEMDAGITKYLNACEFVRKGLTNKNEEMQELKQ
jgi:hypothetical protein